jgi:hypothetical protein
MNENNKSFYPSDMFEFIHHPKNGRRDLKGVKFLDLFIFEKLIFPTMSKIAMFVHKNTSNFRD